MKLTKQEIKEAAIKQQKSTDKERKKAEDFVKLLLNGKVRK
tara:strand:+ start:407 stop:529 length:123 start_codon:yes stop_codon:yes gene_type:complete